MWFSACAEVAVIPRVDVEFFLVSEVFYPTQSKDRVSEVLYGDEFFFVCFAALSVVDGSGWEGECCEVGCFLGDGK